MEKQDHCRHPREVIRHKGWKTLTVNKTSEREVLWRFLISFFKKSLMNLFLKDFEWFFDESFFKRLT